MCQFQLLCRRPVETKVSLVWLLSAFPYLPLNYRIYTLTKFSFENLVGAEGSGSESGGLHDAMVNLGYGAEVR